MMSNTGTFTLHIINIVIKDRGKFGWVLRVFQWQKHSLMLTLLKSLVIPQLEYCCQLWNPYKKDIQAIKLFNECLHTKALKHKIWTTGKDSNYTPSRDVMNFIYNYIYLEDNTAYGAKYWWYIGHKMKTSKHPRHGTQCVIQYPTNRNPEQSLHENAIIVFGLRLYNSLPKYLRDIESVKTEKYKFEPDKFIELIPDEPKMPNYVTASGSNGILHQLTHLMAQGIYQCGGVPDFSCFETTPSIQVSKYIRTFNCH